MLFAINQNGLSFQDRWQPAGIKPCTLAILAAEMVCTMYRHAYYGPQKQYYPLVLIMGYSYKGIINGIGHYNIYAKVLSIIRDIIPELSHYMYLHIEY